MVFGNRGRVSGSGVCFTRDPATGAGRVRRLPRRRPGRGRRRRHPQHHPARRPRGASTRCRTTQLLEVMALLEQHYRDLCDIEFTIERRSALDPADPGRQAHPGGGLPDRPGDGRRGADRRRRGGTPGDRRPARAAAVPAVRPDRPARAADHAASAPRPARPPAGSRSTRRPRSDGRAPATTSSWSASETNPDDLPGMIAARGVLTSRGGKTSHAAVVARGMGRTCVCGAERARGRRREATGPGPRRRHPRRG